MDSQKKMNDFRGSGREGRGIAYLRFRVGLSMGKMHGFANESHWLQGVGQRGIAYLRPGVGFNMERKMFGFAKTNQWSQGAGQ